MESKSHIDNDLSDSELLRYSRQIMLPQFGFEAQKKLLGSRVLLIGIGGLGSISSMYLVAAGVGHIVISDDDVVEITNLQRQIIYNTDEINQKKVQVAKNRLQKINPNIQISIFDQKLEGELLSQEVSLADIVIDGTDNYKSRFEINKQCVMSKTALVSAATIRFEGQLTVFNVTDNSPCYSCLYQDTMDESQTCAENGVLSAVPGVFGSLQAVEAIKFLAEVGNVLDGELLIVDNLMNEFRKIKLKKDMDCLVCGQK
ncbi:MAG: molybdopterin-synthase adenylyltransferase MoeB [Methylococcales bacterium]|nr:molybdopterin-synthase adenylyltransferase MoeB [Methylococcales bacterium]